VNKKQITWYIYKKIFNLCSEIEGFDYALGLGGNIYSSIVIYVKKELLNSLKK